MEEVITKTELPLKLFSRGKVRDTYELDGGNLLMVASDRLSAFDVVFSEGIPYKGKILSGLSLFWFEKLKGVVENHLISTEMPSGLPSYLKGRSMIVKRAAPIKLECVVRGYLAGSGLKEYNSSGTVCGVKLPSGLKNSSKLPSPIFTPSTKADVGHDINVNDEEGRRIVGDATYDEVKSLSLKIYSTAADYARTRGIILADTKFEFGLYNGKIILIDEVLTPDSSRYWPSDLYKEGQNQPSYDKQFVRDYLESTGWDKKPPAPNLPQEVIVKTSEKYVEAYEKLTGKSFER
ncbi:TPA: phosphoribosylaminoimidazolesuccinocarboxamide synthase [Candidatus Micrarchaeota archaeon]|nr:phosphoribosylaminoimidazolesuccinocarboxamide synthase [Candidatus Micrarchaeota archaeon]HIH30796.1 phosphoribosylaminoimidazolesuccinocarboxamide synthase [Candidatus Micrarchaeota archaeon]